MTPRRKAVLRLLLCACPLWAAAAVRAQQPAAAAEVDSSTRSVRSELETLGYRYDEASKDYVGHDGAVLSPQRLRAYLAPFDYRRHDISEDARTGMLLDGYRFEPATGHVLSAETHKPISNLDYESHRVSDAADERRDSLERLNALLDKQDPGKPVGPLARLEGQRLLEDRQLPAALSQDLNSATKLAGAIASDAHAAYLDETRAYDGTISAKDLAARVVPLAAPDPNAVAHPYFDAAEKTLGDALQKAAIARLGRNPVGVEVLAHFKDASGALHLPALVVLPVDSGAAALYASGIVAINQADFVDSIASKAPAFRRAGLRARLKDSRALARYLNAHPGAVEGFVEDNDSVLAHELTHAWQHRRDKFWAEAERDNFPDADYVECEHEAFTVEMRYVHEKLKKDPAALVHDEDDLELYQRFTADIDGWRDQITAEYLEAFPQGAATLKTGEEMQQERVKAARELETNPLFAAIEKAKLLAFGIGSSEEKDYAAGYDKLFDGCQPNAHCFRRDEYPRMQKESKALLAKTFLLKAKSARGFERAEDLYKAVEYARDSGNPALLQRAIKAKMKEQE